MLANLLNQLSRRDPVRNYADLSRAEYSALFAVRAALKDAVWEAPPTIADLVKDHPDRYSSMGLKDLGDEMFDFLRKYDPGTVLNDAYSTIPVPEMTPADRWAGFSPGSSRAAAGCH